MKLEELEARVTGIVDGLADRFDGNLAKTHTYKWGHKEGQRARKSILTAAREQQPARGEAVSFQRESSGGYSLHVPHDPAPGEQQIREHSLDACWEESGTCANCRPSQTQEQEQSKCETMGCAGIPVTEVRWYDHDELLIARYCQDCADMMQEYHEASVVSLKEQINEFKHFGESMNYPEDFGGRAPAQEPMSIKGWADYSSELDRLRLEAIERAEREQYEANNRLIHSETRRIRAEHERDELLAEIAKHKRDTLANYEVDGNTQDWRLWDVLSKYSDKFWPTNREF